jgi:hypothetical protein
MTSLVPVDERTRRLDRACATAFLGTGDRQEPHSTISVGGGADLMKIDIECQKSMCSWILRWAARVIVGEIHVDAQDIAAQLRMTTSTSAIS